MRTLLMVCRCRPWLLINLLMITLERVRRRNVGLGLLMVNRRRCGRLRCLILTLLRNILCRLIARVACRVLPCSLGVIVGTLSRRWCRAMLLPCLIVVVRFCLDRSGLIRPWVITWVRILVIILWLLMMR